MDALIWGEKFVTGLSSVDAQHERLVNLINELGNLSAGAVEVPRERLEQVVEALARYAHTHFTHEEAVMRKSGIDPRFYAIQEGQHRGFLRDVAYMRESNFLASPETTRVLLRFLLHWLAFHILGSDMQLARQIERVKRGESPADAFAAEVHEAEGPAQLLLGAVDEFMRVVAQRNAQLTEANRTLEERVSARTAELEASVVALRTTQVRLVETEKLASVGQLASGLAHEINNPLAFVIANLRTLEDHGAALLELAQVAKSVAPRLPDEDRQRLDAAVRRADLDFIGEDLTQLVSETQEGLKRVQGIVRDLKDFSRVDGSALVELDLKSAVEASLKVLPSVRREGVTVVTAFAPAPRVRCQAAQVNHAVFSLLENAVQAVQDTGRAGTVTVRTGTEGGFVFIEVADAGVGMPSEVLAHAFEPFYTTRPPGQGTGLGLSTAFHCAQAHGGRLDAVSEVGKGSTFRLLLPLESTIAPAPATSSTAAKDYIDRRTSPAAPAIRAIAREEESG